MSGWLYENNFKKNFSVLWKKNYKHSSSLLPKFKGLNTFLRIKKNNEVKSGCTVHYVNEKIR